MTSQLIIEAVLRSFCNLLIGLPVTFLMVRAMVWTDLFKWAGWPDPSMRQTFVIAAALVFLPLPGK